MASRYGRATNSSYAISPCSALASRSSNRSFSWTSWWIESSQRVRASADDVVSIAAKVKVLYVDWSEEWVDEERLQLTTSAQGPPVRSNCLLLMRSYWLALLKKKINDHNQLQLSRLLKMLSISFPSPTCCFKALSPASRAAFFDSKISTDVS